MWHCKLWAQFTSFKNLLVYTVECALFLLRRAYIQEMKAVVEFVTVLEN